MPVENSENPNDIVLFVNQYLFKTFAKSYSKVPMHFDVVLTGYKISIDIDSETYPMMLDTEPDTLRLSIGATLKIPDWNMIIDINASSQARLEFSTEDKERLLTIHQTILKNSVKFEKFKVFVNGHEKNGGAFHTIAKQIVKNVIRLVKLNPLKVPRIPSIPFDVSVPFIKY
eukprot:CAMPEP_0168321992 /NCGR_PEP_ID=MMETSP0213-20121227/2618_1 /TAXON_ID=151035 /ORGANISM="Euplotes harpa, Strain FSP1.4" /LENGTH=171 /DNA_ID=CAMNT_0008323783 /DNA_START=807 /DNA_END=1319 /DNA_ORIENTATION=-